MTSQELEECKTQIDVLSQKCDQNLLKIAGIDQVLNEDCKTICSDFFKNKLKIEKVIPIIDAFRVGDPKSKTRLMMIYLQNPRDKGLIFANTKNLKNLVNANNEPFNVFDQQSAKKRARRNRRRQILLTNKNLDAEQQRTMKMDRGELIIDGSVYEPQLKVPSCRDILLASKEQRSERLNKDVKSGTPKLYQGQEFLGYTTAVNSIKDANIAYAKIKAIHLDARHVICAVRLPGKDYFHNQDYIDDDEHGGGAFLLSLLTESQIQNRAIYIVRKYDGQHIGGKRYELMREAVQSALSRAPANEVTGNHDCIWEQQFNKPIRGSHQGRGSYRGGSRPPRGRGHGPNGNGMFPNDNFNTDNVRSKSTYAEMAKLSVALPEYHERANPQETVVHS